MRDNVLALAAFASGLVFSKTFLHRGDDFRGASAFVHQRIGTGEVVFVPHNETSWCWYFIGPGSVSPVKDETVAVDGQGVSVVSSPALNERPLPGNTYWLVYREKATIAPFNAISHEVELAQEFRGLVKRVLVAACDSSSLMNL
jgi:hypothetical protein